MVGKEGGVYGCMMKKHPDLYLSGCVCHLIHIAAEKGAGCFPFSPSQLLIDMYYYLDKSSNRQSSLKVFQVLHELKETKMLKHVATRWLSIGKCLPRVITSWDALYDFFRDEETKATASTTKKKAGDIKRIFASCTNKLFCHFLVDIIKVFEAINTTLQSDKPMIHCLKTLLVSFFKDLLVRFVKPAAMLYKSLMDVDFCAQINIKSKTDLIIGEQARNFVNQERHKLRPEKIDEFYDCVIKYFKASCTYIKKRLPLSDVLLSHATVVDPAKQVDSSFGDLEYFLKRFPKLLPSGVTITDMQLEFSKYQCTDIRQCISEERVDSTWFTISQLKEDEKLLFPHLPKVMLSILTIPHSSAHCERIFSVVRKNKTEFRGNMGHDTLEALVVAKSRPGDALDRKYSEGDLKDLKSAYYRSLQSK